MIGQDDLDDLALVRARQEALAQQDRVDLAYFNEVAAREKALFFPVREKTTANPHCPYCRGKGMISEDRSLTDNGGTGTTHHLCSCVL